MHFKRYLSTILLLSKPKQLKVAVLLSCQPNYLHVHSLTCPKKKETVAFGTMFLLQNTENCKNERK
jgi:hypothetical protein